MDLKKDMDWFALVHNGYWVNAEWLTLEKRERLLVRRDGPKEQGIADVLKASVEKGLFEKRIHRGYLVVLNCQYYLYMHLWLGFTLHVGCLSESP